MGAVRFSCGDASGEEVAELAQELAALDGVEIRESGEGGGAPFAETIIVVMITVGAPIAYDAVKSFAKWLANRKSKSGPADGTVTLVVRGMNGTCTLTVNSDTDLAKTDLVKVGQVTDVQEAE